MLPFIFSLPINELYRGNIFHKFGIFTFMHTYPIYHIIIPRQGHIKDTNCNKKSSFVTIQRRQNTALEAIFGTLTPKPFYSIYTYIYLINSIKYRVTKALQYLRSSIQIRISASQIRAKYLPLRYCIFLNKKSHAFILHSVLK